MNRKMEEVFHRQQKEDYGLFNENDYEVTKKGNRNNSANPVKAIDEKAEYNPTHSRSIPVPISNQTNEEQKNEIRKLIDLVTEQLDKSLNSKNESSGVSHETSESEDEEFIELKCPLHVLVYGRSNHVIEQCHSTINAKDKETVSIRVIPNESDLVFFCLKYLAKNYKKI